MGQNAEVRKQLSSLWTAVPVCEAVMKQRTSCALEITQDSRVPPGFPAVPHKVLARGMPGESRQREGPCLGSWREERGQRRLGPRRHSDEGRSPKAKEERPRWLGSDAEGQARWHVDSGGTPSGHQ